MEYDLDWLRDSYSKGDRSKYLFFWGHTVTPGRTTATCFSQWYPAPFEAEGITYLTTEHWMMAHKASLFGDQIALDKILASPTPGHAKAYGREVQNFDNDLWEDKRIEIVLSGNLHKFSQHPELKDYLLQTGDKVLVEASPVDFIWGIGLPGDNPKAQDPNLWNGLNLLGFVLMETRDILRQTKSKTT